MIQGGLRNRTIFCEDNLEVLRGINSNSIDLIYLDPPFSKNENFVATKGSKEKIATIKNFFITLQKENNTFINEDFNEIFKNVSFKDIWTEIDIHSTYYTEIDKYNHQLISYFESIRNTTTAGGFYYLIYMLVRLIEMKRILKDTGSIYYHCDSTLSHYIKNVMDKIFGYDNFRNEIVWCYKWGGAGKREFARKHDTILWYSASKSWTFNHLEMREPYTTKDPRWHNHKEGKILRDIWDDIPIINTVAKERVGYPTQKPLKLLERIIQASSNEGDVILDPFCGCATTCVAAERLKRKWIGIDIAKQTYYMVFYRAYHDTFLSKKVNPELYNDHLIHTKEAPIRTDLTEEERQKIASEHGKKEAIKDQKRWIKAEKNIVKKLCYEDQAGMCNGCNVFMRSVDLTIDHIKPRAEEGEDDLENAQLLCFRCNVWKGAGVMKDLFKKLLKENIISQSTYEKQMNKYGKK